MKGPWSFVSSPPPKTHWETLILDKEVAWFPIFDGGRSVICNFWSSGLRTEIKSPIIRSMFLDIEPPEEVHVRVESEVVAKELEAHNGSDGIGGKLRYAYPPITQKILKEL